MTLRRREAQVENAFKRLVTEGARALRLPLGMAKLTLRGRRGWPDWLILLSRRRALLIELKRPGERPTKLQTAIHAAIEELGHEVKTFDDAGAAAAYVLRTAALGAASARRRCGPLASQAPRGSALL